MYIYIYIYLRNITRDTHTFLPRTPHIKLRTPCYSTILSDPSAKSNQTKSNSTKPNQCKLTCASSVPEQFYLSVAEQFYLSVAEHFYLSVAQQFYLSVAEQFYLSVAEQFYLSVAEQFYLTPKQNQTDLNKTNQNKPTCSRLQIGWQKILRLCEKKIQQTRILPMGFTISTR